MLMNNVETGWKNGRVSQENSDLGISGDFWGDGADSAQKVDTLAGQRVSSTPGKRGSPSLGEVMTHP
jgi:hypothetical protein